PAVGIIRRQTCATSKRGLRDDNSSLNLAHRRRLVSRPPNVPTAASTITTERRVTIMKPGWAARWTAPRFIWNTNQPDQSASSASAIRLAAREALTNTPARLITSAALQKICFRRPSFRKANSTREAEIGQIKLMNEPALA